MAAFTCQSCNSPLRVDDSLKHLNPASFDLLTGQSSAGQETASADKPSSIPADRKSTYEKALASSSQAIFQHSAPGANSVRRGIGPGPVRTKAQGLSDTSFIVLSESQLQGPSTGTVTDQPGTLLKLKEATSSPLDIPHESLSHKMEYHNRLFEILSARSNIDHPICTDCSELLLAQFQARLMATNKEKDTFVNYLKELRLKVPTADEVAKASKELEAAKAEEEVQFQNLLQKEAEKEALERELANLEEEELQLQEEETAFWKSRNALHQEITRLQRDRDAEAAAYSHDEEQLARLRKTNVFNDTFSVGHDGSFGTINGLRLGRLPPICYVEWAEINAAWGLAALLLNTVAEKLGFVFQGLKIRPMGSTTKIERLEKPVAGDSKIKSTSLDLFSSGDLPIARGIVHRRFNEAMVAFLECMSQLENFIVKRSSGGQDFALMYAIDKETINGISIRLGQSSDTQWTQACKYTLTNCKLLLAHTSSVETTRSGG